MLDFLVCKTGMLVSFFLDFLSSQVEMFLDCQPLKFWPSWIGGTKILYIETAEQERFQKRVVAREGTVKARIKGSKGKQRQQPRVGMLVSSVRCSGHRGAVWVTTTMFIVIGSAPLSFLKKCCSSRFMFTREGPQLILERMCSTYTI